jgi:hypothetical protein
MTPKPRSDQRNSRPASASPAAAPQPPKQPARKPPPSRLEQVMAQAFDIREHYIARTLSRIVGGDPLGAKVFLNSYLRDAGEPTDPVEKILLEQLMMAHLRLSKLHVRADGVTDPEAVKILNGATSRLLSEIRRMALAIRQYRAPQAPKSFSVVHQQNVVTAGDQKVTYVDQSTAAKDKVTLSARSEVEAETNTTTGFGGRLGDRLGKQEAKGPDQGSRREAPAAVDR